MALRMRGENCETSDGVIRVDPVGDSRWEEFVYASPARVADSYRPVGEGPLPGPFLIWNFLVLPGTDLIRRVPNWLPDSRSGWFVAGSRGTAW